MFQPGENIPPRYRNCYFYILAYSSCKRPETNILSDEEKEELDEVIAAITEIFPVFQQFYVGRELQGVVTKLMDFIRFPVISMGALHWASIPLSDTGWYMTNYNTQSIQYLLELLKEMAYLHVYQRAEILKLLKKCFKLETELEPLPSLDIKKKVLDAIIYLMECGFTMPVISTIEEWANEGLGNGGSTLFCGFLS